MSDLTLATVRSLACQPSYTLSTPPSLLAKTFKGTLVVSLHVLLLFLALRATGVISHQALPLPMVLSAMIVAAPAQPVVKQRPPVPVSNTSLPPNLQVAAAATDLPALKTPAVIEPQLAANPVMTPQLTAPAAQQAIAPTQTEASFDAAYLNNPAPSYPLMSRRNGEAGKVLLLVQVSKQGTAAQVEIKQSCGFARLDEAALEAVRKWRFVPARRGEEAIAASVVVPLTFKINS